MSWFRHDQTVWNYERLASAVDRANRLSCSRNPKERAEADAIFEGHDVYDVRPVAFGIARGHSHVVHLQATTAAIPPTFMKREVEVIYVPVKKPLPDIINSGIGYAEPANHIHLGFYTEIPEGLKHARQDSNLGIYHSTGSSFLAAIDPNGLTEDNSRVDPKGDKVFAAPGTGRDEDGGALIPSLSTVEAI